MRVRMALIVCVAMSLSIIGLPGQEPAAQAVQVAQIREPEYPTGGLQEVDVYEVAGEEAEQVPSYENQITLFRRSSSILIRVTAIMAMRACLPASRSFIHRWKYPCKIFSAQKQRSLRKSLMDIRLLR